MKYEAEVIDVKTETPRVKTLKVTWPGIETLHFVPGQFFMVSIPDFKNDKGIVIKRAYSIANAPEDKGFVEFTITAKHSGGLSERLCRAQVGDKLICEGPAGQFALKAPLRNNITFIAAGSGISSLRSMYRHIALNRYQGNMHLVFGFHAPEDYIYKDELFHMQRKMPTFNVVPAITVDDKDWMGKKGRVTKILPELFSKVDDRDFYICGSPEMVNDTIRVLLEMGALRHNIYREVW